MGFKAELLRQYMLYLSSFCSVSVVCAFLDLSLGFWGKIRGGGDDHYHYQWNCYWCLTGTRVGSHFASIFFWPQRFSSHFFFLKALQFLGKGT